MKYALLMAAAAATIALAGCAGDHAAATNDGAVAQSGRSFSDDAQAASQFASAPRDDGGGKGSDDKGGKNKSDKGKDNKKNEQQGNARKATPVPGVGNKQDKGQKDKPNTDKGNLPGQDTTGWQRGRFKDAIPFAYLPGWRVDSEREMLVLSGKWDDHDYVVEVSRALRVNGDFEQWVNGQLDELGVDEEDVEYGATGRVQIAVVDNLDLDGYDCPAARAIVWTQNPAGRNQRAILVTVSQAEGEACDPKALSAFLVELAARSMDRETPEGTATRIPSGTATVAPTAVPQATATLQSGWQQGQFGPLQLPIPAGWTLTGQGNTAVAQGQYEGRTYVMQAVPYANIEQDSLKDWVESQTDELGLEDDEVQYVTLRGFQAAVLRNLDRDDDLYRCPVARLYLWLQSGDAASSGVIVTMAQMGLQPCDPAALERLVDEMLRQAQG